MLANDVSVVIPVIRPDKVKRCLEVVSQWDCEIIAEEDHNRIGAPLMVKNLVEKTHRDLVMFLGDDTIPDSECLNRVVETMNRFDGTWGLVGMNDGLHNQNGPATHWLAHKTLLPFLDGEFFHTGYRHCFCDNELTERCREMGKYSWCEEAKIFHDHPMLRGESTIGTDYEMPYLPNNFYHDLRLFKQRKANGWRSG